MKEFFAGLGVGILKIIGYLVAGLVCTAGALFFSVIELIAYFAVAWVPVAFVLNNWFGGIWLGLVVGFAITAVVMILKDKFDKWWETE